MQTRRSKFLSYFQQTWHYLIPWVKPLYRIADQYNSYNLLSSFPVQMYVFGRFYFNIKGFRDLIM